MKRVGRVLMIVLLAISGIGAYSAAAQESLVWSFEGYPTDGSKPNAGLISDAEGNLYGTEKSLLQVGPFAWPMRSARRVRVTSTLPQRMTISRASGRRAGGRG